MENSKTPLWLELRKEYIDDNFEKLIPYLHQCSQQSQKDSFFETTCDLLRLRVNELINSLATHPLYDEDNKTGDKNFNIRLLGTYLLVDPNHQQSPDAFLALVSELRQFVPTNKSEALLKAAIHRLRMANVEDYGFTWQDIEELKPEILAYKIIHCSFSGSTLTVQKCYDRYGTAILTDKGLYLTCEMIKEAQKICKTGATTLDTGIGVMIKTDNSLKLKQSQETNIVAMDEFLRDFVLEQCRAQKKVIAERLLPYVNGDKCIVKVISLDGGTIQVETTDPKYEHLKGTVCFSMPNIIFYYASEFYRGLKVGDYLPTTISNTYPASFSIEKQFIEFVIEDTREQIGCQECTCKLITKTKTACVWMNEMGAPIHTSLTENVLGDLACIEITEFCEGKRYGVIKGKLIDGEVGDDYNPTEVQNECIAAFADKTPIPEQAKAEDAETLSVSTLHLLLRIFFAHQKTVLKPSERYHFLILSRIMAEMVGDDISSSYIRFASTYLRILVQFVRGESFKDIVLEPEEVYREEKSALIRLSVLELLKEYGKKENSERLARAIEDYKDQIPMISTLARLIQTANSLQGTLSDAAINVIRREIIKTLSLETENDTDLEAENGAYLGIESGTVEFKTSIIFPPDNHEQPNETVQNKNVMRGICAFMNSTTGGTLYLGVNDQGYISGLQGDMKYLRCKSIDTYIRYVQDTALRAFGKDAMMYLQHIEPMYDDQVLAIHVEPHPYRVVELNGTAYLRVNAESREMPESVRQQLIAKKVFQDRDKAAAISQLQHAYSTQKCVILHNYASSNSGSVKDRHVEAYKVLPEDDLIICYDCDKSEVRVFNINRIGHVEILEDKPWEHTQQHKEIAVDDFHMTGSTTYQISLQLDLFAKNQLVEEYPSSRAHVTQHKGDPNIWYYNAPAYSLLGIGRFYIGLANHIHILQAPDLVKYVEEYKKQYL